MMTVDPSTATLEDVFRAFDDTIVELANAVARLKTEFAEHPRYNEKADEVRAMLGMVQSVAAAAKSFADAWDLDAKLADLGRLKDLTEQLANDLKALAERDAVNPHSVIGRPVPKAMAESPFETLG